ncbi:hypothetical protein K3495_g5662 [Podosphaera aphanis]|nr:hypothetical protein K3495_g5662 [Podosphaera aphanis]
MAAVFSENISSVQRVKTGFAITTTDETIRQKILDLDLWDDSNIEPASKSVAYLIPTVPFKAY